MPEMDLILNLIGNDSPISRTIDNLKRGAGDLIGGITGGGAPGAAPAREGMASGFDGMIKALAPLAVMGAILNSSKSLQAALHSVMRLVGLILKPIGDILAVGLMPIIEILRPIGMFFRILMKPYIQKAMEAMRLGRQFQRKGELGAATESYTLGSAYMMKPIFDTLTTTLTMAVQGILGGFRALGSLMLAALHATDLQAEFENKMDGMIIGVGVTGAKIITESSLMMEGWLVSLKEDFEKIKDNANVKMEDLTGIVGGQFVLMIAESTKFATSINTPDSVISSMFDTIIEDARGRAEELNAILDGISKPTGANGGVAAGGQVTVNSTIIIEKDKAGDIDFIVDEINRRIADELAGR